MVMHVSLGSILFPMRSVHWYSEFMFQVAPDFGYRSVTNSFALAIGCEKVRTVSSTGVNVQGVETRCEANCLADGQNNVKSGVAIILFHLHYQAFIEIRAGSYTLLAY